jgi:phage host-nuclease inhibitor protein Gam
MDDFVQIETLDAVNASLREIADLKRQCQIIDAEANEQIDRIKERAIEKAQKFQERIESLAKGIHFFAEKYREETFPKGQKTVELTFGLIGYRQSTKISITKGTLDLLKAEGLLDGIRTKEEVNKDAMKDWDDAKLKSVKAKKVIEDTFWYEVKEEAITDNLETQVKKSS